MKKYIVNDIQAIREISEISRIEADGTHTITQGQMAGQKYHPSFIYPSQELAEKEVADRHTCISHALSEGRLLDTLSLTKEPQRKSLGASPTELEAIAKQDKIEYGNWKKTLETRWEEINGEKPDPILLARTLANAALIQQAVSHPLFPDFREILPREHRLKLNAQKKAQNYPQGPE